jgi:hypothetical protein
MEEMFYGIGPAGWYAWPYPYFASPWFFTKEDERAYFEGQVNIIENQLV